MSSGLVSMGPGQTERPARHVWDYWRIAWEGRRILATIVGGMLLVALVGTLMLKPRYRATCLIELNLAPTSILGGETERGMYRGNFAEQEHAFKTELAKMCTREAVQNAIDQQALRDKVPALARMKDPVGVLKRQIAVERSPQTNVASLSVSWWDPEEAAILTNAIAQTYVDSDIQVRTRLLEDRSEKLSRQAETSAAEQQRVVARELAILASPDADLETLLALPHVKEVKALEKLQEKLSEAEQALEGLSQTYGRNHDQVRRATAERDEVRRQIDDELKAARNAVEDELRALGGDPSLVQPLSAKEIVSAPQQDINAKLAKDFLTKIKEMKVLVNLLEPKATIIDPALPPERPFAPKLSLNLALALVVGVGFGGGLLVFRDYMDTSVKTLDDVEKDLGLATLAVVPAYEGALTPVAKEAFETLRTGLLFASHGREKRVVLVTSSGPREGKSTVAVELAKTMASAGDSVMLVDCDLRKPAVARILGVSAARGMSNFLADSSDRAWKALVSQVDVRGPGKLALLASGPVAPNPLALLGQPRLPELLREMKGAYDWVIVDSPPLSAVSDSLILASLADLVVVAIRHDATDREVVRRTLQRLAAVEAFVSGAVLTGVDMSKSYNREYYYGRFFYGHYYGAAAAKEAPPSGWRGVLEGYGKKFLKG
jgi:capsular exopolysaccharide synthesis family protein